MKSNKWFDLAALILGPAVLIVLGIILIVDPDSASELVAKIIAWVLVLAGTGLGLRNLLGSSRHTGQIVGACVSLAAGLWLLSHPLALAASLGRVLGVVILIQSLDFQALRAGKKPGALSLATAGAGVLLILIPLTASRLVFVILGLVCLALGVTELVNRLRSRQLPDGSADSDIIDGEKL